MMSMFIQIIYSSCGRLKAIYWSFTPIEFSGHRGHVHIDLSSAIITLNKDLRSIMTSTLNLHDPYEHNIIILVYTIGGLGPIYCLQQLGYPSQYRGHGTN